PSDAPTIATPTVRKRIAPTTGLRVAERAVARVDIGAPESIRTFRSPSEPQRHRSPDSPTTRTPSLYPRDVDLTISPRGSRKVDPPSSGESHPRNRGNPWTPAVLSSGLNGSFEGVRVFDDPGDRE